MKTKDKVKEEKVAIHTATGQSLRLGILLAIVGGYLEAYTFITRDGIFANAQTGNIVKLSIEVALGNLNIALQYIPPIIAFILGVIVVERIKDIELPYPIQSVERSALVIEMITLFIIGFIPKETSNIIITVIIAFVSSVQVSSFRKLVDSPFSSAMCTGNLRTAAQTAYIAIHKGDKKARAKFVRFIIIILAFMLGAFLGSIITMELDVKSIWFIELFLMGAFVLFDIDKFRVKSGKMRIRKVE